MARLNKTARGKHRWVGIRSLRNLSRDEVRNLVKGAIEGVEWRLFDVIESDVSTLAIVKVRLEDYPSVVPKLNVIGDIETITSSGKIRLVRSRIFEIESSE